MNRVIEYIIKAKDLASKAFEKVGESIKGTTKEAKEASEAMSKVENAVKNNGEEADKTSKLMEAFGDGLEKVTGKAAKSAGRLEDLLSGMGKFGSTAVAVIGAFKVGWDIGTWLNEHVVEPLFGITDPIEDLKKHNREMAAAGERAYKEWGESMDSFASKVSETVDSLSQERAIVEALEDAYQKLEAAKEKMIGAGDEAELLKLQRERADALRGIDNQSEKSVKSAEFDVLEAQLRMRQELAKFDREAERSAHARESAEEALSKSQDEQIEKRRALAETEKRLRDLENGVGEGANVDFDHYDEAERKLKAEIAQRKKELAAVDMDVMKREQSLEALDESDKATGALRSNLEERLTQSIEAAQDKVSEAQKKLADEKAKEEADAIQKAWEEEQKMLDEEQRAWEQWQNEQLREQLDNQRKIHQQRLKDATDEYNQSRQLESEAQNRLSAAKGQVSQAWGWYRNTDSMQAVIDEKKAQEEAEKQWEKDFDRLKSRNRNWRSAEMGTLSAEDEAVRQVALAKEEEQAAQKALEEISENTAYLKDIAEAIAGEDEG